MKKCLLYLVVVFLLPVSLIAQGLVAISPFVQVQDGKSYMYRFSLQNNFDGSVIKPGSITITSNLSILQAPTNADVQVVYTGNNVGSTNKTGVLTVKGQYYRGGNSALVVDLSPITINVTIIPTLYRSVAISKTFWKNNCGDWYLAGPGVTYTVPEGRYTSYESQGNANAQAQADIDREGQNYANANGTCVREKEVRTPKGTVDYEWTDYKENVYWDVTRITGTAVKVERVGALDNSVVVLAANAPNNGVLVNGLNKTMPPAAPCVIRVTSLQTGQVFLSDWFGMTQD